MLEFLYSNVEYIYKLIKHIEHKILAEAVAKIIAFENGEAKYLVTTKQPLNCFNCIQGTKNRNSHETIRKAPRGERPGFS